MPIQKRKARTKRDEPIEKVDDDARPTPAQLAMIGASVVDVAAKILDEELAAGIVAAKRAQERFVRTRRVDVSDLSEALAQVKEDSNYFIDAMIDLSHELGSPKMATLTKTFAGHARGLIDVAIEMTSIGASVFNEVVPVKKTSGQRKGGKRAAEQQNRQEPQV
ncbi:MAG: hypothetical protein ACRERW_01325 [Pseudomonas sp.]